MNTRHYEMPAYHEIRVIGISCFTVLAGATGKFTTTAPNGSKGNDAETTNDWNVLIFEEPCTLITIK